MHLESPLFPERAVHFGTSPPWRLWSHCRHLEIPSDGPPYNRNYALRIPQGAHILPFPFRSIDSIHQTDSCPLSRDPVFPPHPDPTWAGQFSDRSGLSLWLSGNPGALLQSRSPGCRFSATPAACRRPGRSGYHQIFRWCSPLRQHPRLPHHTRSRPIHYASFENILPGWHGPASLRFRTVWSIWDRDSRWWPHIRRPWNNR